MRDLTLRRSTRELRAGTEARVRDLGKHDLLVSTARNAANFRTRRRLAPPQALSVWVLVSVAVTVGVGMALSGCGHKPAADTDTSLPAVSVSQPIAREIIDSIDFIGRMEAPSSLDVRARVTGYLIKIPFREGAEVRAGDLLFEIDNRPYKDELVSDRKLPRRRPSCIFRWFKTLEGERRGTFRRPLCG